MFETEFICVTITIIKESVGIYLKSYGITSVGRIRKKNQDYFFATDNKIGKLNNLYIVADGMGGHKAGEVASYETVERLVDYIKQNDDSDLRRLIEKGIQFANLSVYNQSVENEQYTGMGTTLVVACIDNDILHIFNVGDSRLYVYTDGLKQITLDHSRVEELFRAGLITQQEREDFPNKNIITRAIGINDDVEIDYFRISMESVKYVLLCSDGLTKMMDDNEFEKYFYNITDLELTCKALLDDVNGRGGIDNTTIIVVDVNGEE